jgi:four helix bundle protein
LESVHKLPEQPFQSRQIIAEGSSRSSEKDYNRFLEISLGSSFELETQLLISGAAKYGDTDLRNSILKSVDEEQKMLDEFL